MGNVRTALYNWLYARQKGGAFVLRIEDTDAERSRPEYERMLMDDLRWLGLDWDEGIDAGGAFGPYRQTDRWEHYRAEAQSLLEGDKAYYCFCTPEQLDADRAQQTSLGQTPHYVGRCRDIDPNQAARRVQGGEKATLRLKVRPGTIAFEDLVFGAVEVDCSTIGDFILVRSDGSPQYNFAVVVDDVEMRISHVIRGEGHLSNTPRQLLVYEALSHVPPRFAHLSTILGSDGQKLSKRHGAASVDEFRKQGFLANALVNYLALLGWAPKEGTPEVLDPDELIREFDLGRVHKTPATFDPEKLNWVNRSHLKKLSPPALAQLAWPYLQRAGFLSERPSGAVQEWIQELSAAFLNYIDRLEDLPGECRLLFGFDPAGDTGSGVAETLAEEGAWNVIQTFAEEISDRDPLSLDSYKGALQRVKARTGAKGKALFHPIRVALTARTSGLELDKLVPLLESGKNLDLPKPVLGIHERVRRILELRK